MNINKKLQKILYENNINSNLVSKEELQLENNILIITSEPIFLTSNTKLQSFDRLPILTPQETLFLLQISYILKQNKIKFIEDDTLILT